MKKLFIFFLIFLPFGAQDLSAQAILNRIENKAKRKINERIERKADEKIDEELDKIFEKDNTPGNNQQPDSNYIPGKFSEIFGNKNTVCKAESSYLFSTETKMDIYSTGEKSKDSFHMTYYFLTENQGHFIGMKTSGSNMPSSAKADIILNLKDSCMIMLTDANNMKIGMVLSTKDTKSDEGASLLKPVKTGKTKTILGKTCYEYVAEDKEMYQQYWVAEGDVKLWDSYSQNGISQLPSGGGKTPVQNPNNGLPLESVYKHKKENTALYYFVREINTNKKTSISTEGYVFY